jgi:hypothetical protein
VENNVFENTPNPIVAAYSDVPGLADTSGNIFINSPYTAEEHPASCEATIPYSYNAVLQDAEEVAATVISYAGVGKLGEVKETKYLITVNTTEGGSVIKDPNYVSFDSGLVVTLTAVPESGYNFVSWGGDASGTDLTTTVTMNENKTVSAAFEPVSTGVITANIFPELLIYPNPVSLDKAKLKMVLPETDMVSVSLFSLTGQKTSILEKRIMPAGNHEIYLRNYIHQRGLYIIQWQVSDTLVTKWMVVR